MLASSLERYLERLRRHLRRDDLRLFSYLDRTARGVEAFWTFVAPDDGTIAVYNESPDLIHTFYRPRDPSMRMNAVVREWIEVVRRDIDWQLVERWAWRR